MKKLFFFKFNLAFLAIGFFSLIVSFLLVVNIIHANTGGGGLDKDNWLSLTGWAWSPNIGWLSLNCHNDFDGDGDIDDHCTIPYGLNIDTSLDDTVRAVGGCAWAGNVGWWICFDDPASTEAPKWGVYLNDYYYALEPPPGGLDPVPSLVPNSLFHGDDWLTQPDNKNGHASILPLEGQIGWSNELGFPIAGGGAGTLDSCFNCTETKTCSNNPAQNCIEDSECGEGNSCVTEYNCANCLQYSYDSITDELTEVIAGYDCSTCTLTQGIDTMCTENAYRRNANTCAVCAKYYSTPGLIVDYSTSTNSGYGSMCGWAWNQDGDTNNGVGWIQFGPRITAGNNPYFQVDSGDIYAKGEIKNKYPLAANKHNAFIIETSSNNIYQVYASSSLNNLLNRPVISFPTLGATGKYTNVLGSIDYNGLITEVGETGKNKYGSVIDNIVDNSLKWQQIDNNGGEILLENTVYYSQNPRIIDGAELVIKSGKNSQNASGVFVFGGGPVWITNNIKYSANNSEANNLKNVSSLVWIIKGDLFIDPSVTEISGTFIILGDGTSCDDGTEWGCGRFISSENSSPNQLKINGSVLARKFVLNRTYSTNNEPAEQFINDGRLKVNPPAGLQGFAKNLPKFNY